jgi:hypothetical protein
MMTCPKEKEVFNQKYSTARPLVRRFTLRDALHQIWISLRLTFFFGRGSGQLSFVLATP